MRAEEFITEIRRMSQFAYTGDVYQPHHNPKKLIDLPGGSGLKYRIGTSHYGPRVEIWDPKGMEGVDTNTPKPKKMRHEFQSEYDERVKQWEIKQSKKSLLRLVGYLNLSTTKFPIKNALQVGSIAVDPEYRKRGIGMALYGIVLTIMKRTLVAGDEQTPSGRKAWVNLSSIPGVEVKGYVVVEDSDIATDRQANYHYRPGIDSADRAKIQKNLKKYDKQGQENIDILMGKLGGQYIGRNAFENEVFAFDVEPSNGELSPVVKTKLSSVYGSYEFNFGLYAKWTGE